MYRDRIAKSFEDHHRSIVLRSLVKEHFPGIEKFLSEFSDQETEAIYKTLVCIMTALEILERYEGASSTTIEFPEEFNNAISFLKFAMGTFEAHEIELAELLTSSAPLFRQLAKHGLIRDSDCSDESQTNEKEN